MDFSLSKRQEEVAALMKQFAEEKVLPGVIERDEKGEFPLELYKEMGKLGFLGLPYPEEYGGQGAGYQEYVMAVEGISKVDASMGISYSVSTTLYGGPVFTYGSEEIKKKYLPEVLKGETLGAFGLTEPNAGSDAAGVVTKAEKKGDHYVLNGMKCFTTNGPLAK